MCRQRRARPDSAQNGCSLSRRGVYALFSRYLAGAQGSVSRRDTLAMDQRNDQHSEELKSLRLPTSTQCAHHVPTYILSTRPRAKCWVTRASRPLGHFCIAPLFEINSPLLPRDRFAFAYYRTAVPESVFPVLCARPGPTPFSWVPPLTLPQWHAAPLILSSIGGAVFLFAAEFVAIWLPQSTARCPMAQLGVSAFGRLI